MAGVGHTHADWRRGRGEPRTQPADQVLPRLHWAGQSFQAVRQNTGIKNSPSDAALFCVTTSGRCCSLFSFPVECTPPACTCTAKAFTCQVSLSPACSPGQLEAAFTKKKCVQRGTSGNTAGRRHRGWINIFLKQQRALSASMCWQGSVQLPIRSNCFSKTDFYHGYFMLSPISYHYLLINFGGWGGGTDREDSVVCE